MPPTVSVCPSQAKSPQDCTVPIDKILVLPEDDLLSALSEHLGEMSGNGSDPIRLNRWERIVYYADELWTEVNSGGFGGYLYYYGIHFEEACQAMATLSASRVQSILGSVRKKFPKNPIPKREDRLQNMLDDMEEQGVDFEKEDKRFYSVGEKELMQCMLTFVKENKKHFR